MNEPLITEQVDLLQYSHSNMGMLYTSSDVPDWMEDWCQWARRLLLREWSVYVSLNDYPNPQNEKVAAKTEHRPEYLMAEMIYRRDIQNDEDGWVAIVHEFVHAFLSNMSGSAYNIARFGNASFKRLQGEKDVDDEFFDPIVDVLNRNYHDAEETVVVKLSRMLVGLRQKQMSLESALKENEDGISEATKSLGNS